MFKTVIAAILTACPGAAWAGTACFDASCSKTTDIPSLIETMKDASADIPQTPAQAQQSPSASPRYQLLRTQAEVDAEYCGNDFHVIQEKSPCSPHDSQTLRIPFPEDFASLIAGHVRRMEENGYFKSMDPSDFFHGHLIIYGKTKQYASLEDALADVTAYLYHTAEYNNRWEDAEARLPIAKKTPRSLVGKPDGSLVLAIKTVDPAKLHGTGYKDFGTIYSGDLVESNPKLSRLSYNFGQSEDVSMDFDAHGRRITCTLDSQFYVRPDAGGRFSLEDGRKYDVYALCDLGVRPD
jgi:hypothetical protein